MTSASVRCCKPVLQVAAMALPVLCAAQVEVVQLAFPLDCRPGATWLLSVRMRHSGARWLPGIYRAEYALFRDPHKTKVAAAIREYNLEARKENGAH